MEAGMAIQILGVIIQTYASVLAIGAGFFTFLIQRYLEKRERKEGSVEYNPLPASGYRDPRKLKRIYLLFAVFFILCFAIIALSFIFMGIAESTPSEILNYEVWFMEGLATAGLIYVAIFVYSLLHLD